MASLLFQVRGEDSSPDAHEWHLGEVSACILNSTRDGGVVPPLPVGIPTKPSFDRSPRSKRQVPVIIGLPVAMLGLLSTIRLNPPLRFPMHETPLGSWPFPEFRGKWVVGGERRGFRDRKGWGRPLARAMRCIMRRIRAGHLGACDGVGQDSAPLDLGVMERPDYSRFLIISHT